MFTGRSFGVLLAMACVSAASVTAEDRLVVHEWGTFTSFSGSNGAHLAFRPLVDNDLPPFVLDRARQAGHWSPFVKLRYVGRQRMETPVTYFYTDRERTVRVRVGFPDGLLTEFYPPVKAYGPEYKLHQAKPPVWLGDPDQEVEHTPGKSWLDWGQVTLIPQDSIRVQLQDAQASAAATRRIRNLLPPDVFDHPHYAYARRTDSAFVHVNRPADPQRPRQPSGDFFEKFLFYRGVGDFPLPVQVEAVTAHQYLVRNTGDQRIDGLFLVMVNGNDIRFLEHEGIDAGAELLLDVPRPSRKLQELKAAVVASLEAQGLYRKEAVSMVDTWRDSWFGESGTRFFYSIPQQLAEELLPLTITPKPDETVRVLVGRLEIMHPETEKQIREVVERHAKLRAQHQQQKNAPQLPVPDEIQKLGRLADPALVRVAVLDPRAMIQREVRTLRLELRNDWLGRIEAGSGFGVSE